MAFNNVDGKVLKEVSPLTHSLTSCTLFSSSFSLASAGVGCCCWFPFGDSRTATPVDAECEGEEDLDGGGVGGPFTRTGSQLAYTQGWIFLSKRLRGSRLLAQVSRNLFCTSEGCSIKQFFVEDLIKVLVLDLNFFVKFIEDLFSGSGKSLVKTLSLS